jgi:hypothetical protein
MKPICVPCKLFFRAEKNGYYFEEGMPTTSDRNGPWQSYKLWSGDLWRCRGCGAEIIVGTGANPMAEHYQSDYAAKIERYQPEIRVDDC